MDFQYSLPFKFFETFSFVKIVVSPTVMTKGVGRNRPQPKKRRSYSEVPPVQLLKNYAQGPTEVLAPDVPIGQIAIYDPATVV